MKEIKTLRKIVSMYFLRKALIMNIYENYTKKKKARSDFVVQNH